MAARVYTMSQEAQAMVLLSRSHAWTKARRKTDGRACYIFPSSRTAANGAQTGYFTASDASVCTCPGYWHRLACSHVLAVDRFNEQVPDGWTVIDPAERAIEAEQLARWAREPDAPRPVERERELCTAAF